MTTAKTTLLILLSAATILRADSPWLYGIHWVGSVGNGSDIDAMTGGKDIWTPDMHERAVTNGLIKKWQLMYHTFPDAPLRIAIWPVREGYNELSERFQPVFNITHDAVKKLKKELMEKSGGEVILPPPLEVSEETRRQDFYDKLLKRIM